MYNNNFNIDLVPKHWLYESVADIRKNFMSNANCTIHFRNRKNDRDITQGEMNNLLNHPSTNIKLIYFDQDKRVPNSLTYHFIGFLDNELWCVVINWSIKHIITPITVFKLQKVYSNDFDPYGWTNQTTWLLEDSQSSRGYYFKQKLACIDNANKYFNYVDNETNQPIHLNIPSPSLLEVVRKIEYNGKSYYVLCFEDPTNYQLYFSNKLIPEDEVCLETKIELTKTLDQLKTDIKNTPHTESNEILNYIIIPLLLLIIIIFMNLNIFIIICASILLLNQLILYKKYTYINNSNQSYNELKIKIDKLNKYIKLHDEFNDSKK
ncbi:MAG: hypothetical protein RR430_04215 [Anaerorhabdus sp.]